MCRGVLTTRNHLPQNANSAEIGKPNLDLGLRMELINSYEVLV